MTYNSRIDRVYLYGGLDTITTFDDTWYYDYNENSWESLKFSIAPGPRYYHTMDYDSESNVVVTFGGRNSYNPVGPLNNETWIFHSPIDIPASPTNLQVTEINGKVNLTWNVPSTDGGSPITEYVIYRGNDSDSLTQYSAVSEVEVTHFQDTEVTRSQTYFYAIRVKNAIGESESSNIVSITIPTTTTCVSGFPLILTSAFIICLAILRKNNL